MSEIDRIRADLARAKERVAQIERGERGMRPAADWRQDTDGNLPGHALGNERQLLAQRSAVERFELELVQAMIPCPWGPAAIIEAMAHRCPEQPTALQVINVDDTREALHALLSADPGKFINRSKLEAISK